MSYRLLIKIAALASTCWMSVSQALAENRMALVIGNSNYATVAALPNPANDAKAMAKFLSSAGFQVLQAPDLSQSDMRRTIGNFASMVAEKGADTVALVFYAGHGLQVDGENYLVPIDASIQREGDVPLQAVRLADLMNALAVIPSKARIVILDACRNNPFSEINKTAGRGLAIVDAPNGSLVSYSTAPGTEAQDGEGANSPFTSAFVKIGEEPSLPIEQALKRVRLAVNDSTNRQQTPWESSSLTSEFSFFPSATEKNATANAALPTKAAGSSATPAGLPVTPASLRAETRSVDSWEKELKAHTAREAYEIVIREDRVEAYQAYLELYPSQSLAPAVRTIVDRRREMISWYNAVTINTVAAYQSFLGSYATSDFAATADRLISRALTRSVANGASAFASAGPTCPCGQPPATPRLKRADVSPNGNSPGGPGTGAPGTDGPIVGSPVIGGPVLDGPAGGGTVVVVEPPYRPRHVRGHDDDPPKRPVYTGDPPSRSVGKVTKLKVDKIERTKTDFATRRSTTNRSITAASTKSMGAPVIRRTTMGSSMPMGRPFLGGMGRIGGRRFF